MIVAVVPVKRLSNAKQRLTGILGESQRARLALAMLGDVLSVLADTRSIESVVAIGSDDPVSSVATASGARFVWESPSAGNLNRAIEEAVAAHVSPKDKVLVLPADVPAVTTADLERLLALAPDRGIVVVPAIDGGTNALLLSPGDVIRPRFGPNSAERHAQAAAQAGASHRMLVAESLSRDIDTCDDLYWALGADRIGARTREFLDREVAPLMPPKHAARAQSITGA